MFNIQIEPEDIEIVMPTQAVKPLPKVKVSDLAVNHSIIIEESSVSSSSNSQEAKDFSKPRELITAKQ